MPTRQLSPDELKLQTDIRCLADLKAEIKGLEAREEALAAAVMEQIFTMPDVFLPDGKISYQSEIGRTAVETKETRTISAAMLIAQGVAVEKVEAATTVTQSKPYVRIYPARAKAGEGRE